MIPKKLHARFVGNGINGSVLQSKFRIRDQREPQLGGSNWAQSDANFSNIKRFGWKERESYFENIHTPNSHTHITVIEYYSQGVQEIGKKTAT